MDKSQISLTITIYAWIAGVISSQVFGKYANRLDSKPLWLLFWVVSISLIPLWIVRLYLPLWVALLLCGWLYQYFGTLFTNAKSLFLAIFNVSIGAGVLVGSIVITNFGLLVIGPIRASFIALAMAVFW